MGKQSNEAKKKQSREAAGKYLLQLVASYVHESHKQDEVRKKELYFKHRSEWYSFCDRMNSKKSKLLLYKRDAFKDDVDKNYVPYVAQLFPETSRLKLFFLKRKTHSFA
jgi:hypothetical protein